MLILAQKERGRNSFRVEQQLSLSRGHCPLSLPASVIAQGNIHKDIAAGGFEADDEGFGILATLRSIFSVEDGGMHAEVEALIVKRGNGISGDLICQLAYGFPHQRV